MNIVKMLDDAHPSPPPRSHAAGEGGSVVQMVFNRLHEVS
jgi:hypothetical protein